MKKEQLSSRLMVYLVAISSAVGLGNLWKFPTLTGENGGAAFVLIYTLASLIVGIPLLISEFMIGRHTGTNVANVYNKLKVSKYWNLVSIASLIANFLIITFYTVIIGWVYIYIFKAIKGDFNNPTLESVSAQFDSVVSSPIAFAGQAVVILIVAFVLYKGISGGIEKAVRVLAPIFLALLVVVFINSLRLDGFGEAMDFLFTFDFSKITLPVIISALGLAFFKLSLGSAAMITYASYFTRDTDLPKTAATVAVSDVAISLLAGMALFPVVFTFGLEPTAGPGLLFNTVPLAFSGIPFGNVLTIIFFALAGIVGTTAAISLTQVQFAILSEKLNVSRATVTAILVGTILGVSILTMFPFSLFGDATINSMTLFDAFDYYSSNYILPLVGLVTAIFAGWVLRTDVIKAELGESRIIGIWSVLVRYVVPAIIFIVFLNGIGILKF